MSDQEYESLVTGTLLVAISAHLRPGKTWPMDEWTFVEVLQKVTSEGPNLFADRFRLYPGMRGQYTPDFKSSLNYAMHSGLVAYVCPSYDKFVPQVSVRTIAKILREHSEEEIRDAETVMKAYAEATGFPV